MKTTPMKQLNDSAGRCESRIYIALATLATLARYGAWLDPSGSVGGRERIYDAEHEVAGYLIDQIEAVDLLWLFGCMIDRGPTRLAQLWARSLLPESHELHQALCADDQEQVDRYTLERSSVLAGDPKDLSDGTYFATVRSGCFRTHRLERGREGVELVLEVLGPDDRSCEVVYFADLHALESLSEAFADGADFLADVDPSELAGRGCVVVVRRRPWLPDRPWVEAVAIRPMSRVDQDWDGREL